MELHSTQCCAKLIRFLFGLMHNLAKSGQRQFQPFVVLPHFVWQPHRHGPPLPYTKTRRELKEDTVALASNSLPLSVLATLNVLPTTAADT
jgi:hypothetical protein